MNSRCLQEAPAYETAAELQEGFVDFGSPFESDSEPTKLMQPRDSSFDYPARDTQAAAMFGSAPSNLGSDTFLSQRLAMRVRVIGPIGLQQSRFTLGASDLACYGRNLINQWYQLR